MGILPSILPSMLPHLLVQVMIWICHTCVVQNHIIVLPCTVRAVLSASLVLSDFIHPQWVLACHQKCRSLYLCFYAYICIIHISISACVWFHAPVATGQVLAHQLFLLQQCRARRAQQCSVELDEQGRVELDKQGRVEHEQSTHCVYRESWESICKPSLVLYHCNINPLYCTNYQCNIHHRQYCTSAILISCAVLV